MLTRILDAARVPTSAATRRALRTLGTIGAALGVVVAAVGVPHLIAQHTRSELVEDKSVAANVRVERFAASAAAPLVADSAADLRAEFERLRRDDQVTYAALWRSGVREPYELESPYSKW